jgi:syntenin-1
MAHVQRAVEVKAAGAVAAAAAPAGAGGLYDWAALDSLQQLMYGSTDISPAALRDELGAEVAQIYSAPRVQNAENRLAMLTAPDNLGIARSEIKQGLRPLLVCKDAKGILGIAPVVWDNGVFVGFVWAGSPAAMAGIRFGDQILRINGEATAAWSQSKVLKVLRSADAKGVEIVVRDRPYARCLTFQKDAQNLCGFGFKYGEITSLVKDSSAVRNGLLTKHHILEVNGQNVVGMSDKDILRIIQESPMTVTITIAPSFIYKKMINGIGYKRIKKYMDHSVPEV